MGSNPIEGIFFQIFLALMIVHFFIKHGNFQSQTIGIPHSPPSCPQDKEEGNEEVSWGVSTSASASELASALASVSSIDSVVF